MVVNFNGADMTEEKTWTKEEITQMLENNPVAVERAILRLNDNLPFLYARFNFGTVAWIIENKIKKFAQFLRGQDENGVKRWEPKSLTHRIADRQLKKVYYPEQKCIDSARKVALHFIDYIVNVANNHYEKEREFVEQIQDWPERIGLGGPSQRRYGDRYEHELVFKDSGYSLPNSQWPTFYAFERLTVQEAMQMQSAWRSRNKYQSINSIDPQYIIDRYHYVKTTHSYLD